jgi:flavin reductase (DIM6/NTAB) family NADH-FMN oxidoreductase RutF
VTHSPVPDAMGEPSAVVPPAAYRAVMRGFPTGVAVITALDDAATPHGLTCTSLTSVSLAPPVLLSCLDVASGTLAAMRASGRFAVNLLHAQGRYAAEVFSSAGPDRFSRIRWRPSEVLGVPWLSEDALAVVECSVLETIPVADHVIVLGRVVSTSGPVDAELPLLHGFGQFAAWTPGVPMTSSVT